MDLNYGHIETIKCSAVSMLELKIQILRLNCNEVTVHGHSCPIDTWRVIDATAYFIEGKWITL